MRYTNPFILFLLLIWPNNTQANDALSVNDVRIRAGSTAQLVVSIESNTSFSIYAYDFRLYLPEGIQVATKENGSYIYTLKKRNEDHTPYVQPTTDGAILFGVSSPTLPLTGNTGEVLAITLAASSELPDGTYTAAITNITYANKEAQTLHPADITFDIVVRNLATTIEEMDTPNPTSPSTHRGSSPPWGELERGPERDPERDPDVSLYDLAGRRLTKPAAKGVYVVKGRKVVVK